MAQQAVEEIDPRPPAGGIPLRAGSRRRHDGTVVFYNEPAERSSGCASKRPAFAPRRPTGSSSSSDDPAAGPEEAGRPLVTALQQRRSAHARRWLLRRGDRVRLQVELTAFPIIDQDERLLGAVAMFWERQGP